MTFPATKQGVYGYVKASWYDQSSSNYLFDPNSGYSNKIKSLFTGDAGLGLQVFKNIGAHAAVGFALGNVQVNAPGGSDSKWVPGITVVAGLDYELRPRWKLTFDTRYTDLPDTNFNPLPGVNFSVHEKIFATLVGLRYTI
jgi:opacity protein-like surface antigen